MARKIDTKKILEELLVTMREELKSLTPGSAEYNNLLNNICSVSNELTKLKQATDQAEDNTEKREEQKRMNDEELKFKQAQLELDQVRAIHDKEMRSRQFRGNLIIDFGRLMLAGIGEAAYEHRWKRAMDCEYTLSDQTSVFPPASINRILTEKKPKIVP